MEEERKTKTAGIAGTEQEFTTTAQRAFSEAERAAWEFAERLPLVRAGTRAQRSIGNGMETFTIQVLGSDLTLSTVSCGKSEDFSFVRLDRLWFDDPRIGDGGTLWAEYGTFPGEGPLFAFRAGEEPPAFFRCPEGADDAGMLEEGAFGDGPEWLPFLPFPEAEELQGLAGRVAPERFLTEEGIFLGRLEAGIRAGTLRVVLGTEPLSAALRGVLP